jgi:hypothetical protein
MTTVICGEQGATATFSGFLSIRTAFEGSKSERPQPFLEVAEGLVPVFLKGDNPFSNAAIQPYLNKQVTCTGSWHRQTFVVSEITESVQAIEIAEPVAVVKSEESVVTAESASESVLESDVEAVEPEPEATGKVGASSDHPTEEIVDEDSSSEE